MNKFKHVVGLPYRNAGTEAEGVGVGKGGSV